MISVYDRNETDFFHNGIVLSEVIHCTIEEELNGKYVLELVHPIDKQGKWEYLIEENIIKADGQLFRIYATEKTLDRIYVYARHIFYDLLHNFLEDVRPTNSNGAAALDWILSHTLYPHPFTSTSDIDTVNTRYFIRTNPVDAILGPDGIAERWGGELVRDNFTIKLLKQRGSNKGAKIVYGKNLLGLEVKRDMDTVVTRIMPIGRDELLLPEKYVDSPLTDNYIYPRVRVIQFDIGVDEETTEEEAYEKLRQASRELYEKNKIDIPAVNITVNLLLLENTEEYKNLKQLEKVELGDIVSCTDNPLKITFEAKVIRVKKDVIANRNVGVELGQYKKGISNTIKNAIKDISEEIRNTTSNLEKAIEDATLNLMVFNYLMNSRADEGFSHWSNVGWEIDATRGKTGTASFKCVGSPTQEKFMEQVVYPSNRENYVISFEADVTGVTKTSNTRIGIEVEIEYEDGSTEVKFLPLA